MKRTAAVWLAGLMAAMSVFPAEAASYVPMEEAQYAPVSPNEDQEVSGQRHRTDEAAALAASLQTPHALVMEVSTGKVLFEKDADAKLHPASVTKIMTVLLTFEALEQGKLTWDQEVMTSAHAKSMGGSQVFLEEGEVQTVDTLLKCILIASGNDASVAMAEQIAGSEEAFVARMNEKAAQLGMKNTHFVDCCGLTDSQEHYTSARDVALMSRELLLNYPQVVEYSDIWMEDITHVTAKGSSVFTLSNTNKLLRAYSGCDGLKTGSTSRAKFCLSATARRDGIRLIGTVMTAPDSKIRFAEAAQLLNYGFSRCTMYHDDEMEKLPDIEVRGALNQMVRVEYQDTFSYLSTENEDFSQIRKQQKWQEDVAAPLEKGAKVGELVYTLGDKEIGRVAIVTAEGVERADYFDWVQEMWRLWTI
ncbi:MAG: D-alanyl-D-alanine carboxypeptidase family protein [Lachnospiraceae bacterium]|uniref:D-alanyl-D-alanine carboxypeptidase family protein n=1 Tax=Parablautia sp. Marseille-Q6255 TaxID=3039593 RepID=UPI0024BC58EE|nr:D-alanyl-D-alanine carboxypeptidase family protein [Parablautia sp. Marseille-Q6255]